ncbi:MAG: DUF58 domain-containing protein [Acidimicrobiales bacterium]
MPVLTRRLAGVIAAGGLVQLLMAVVDPARGPAVLVSWLVTAALVTGVDHHRTPAPAMMEVRRHLPGVVALGDAAEVSWRLTNRSGRDLTVGVADELAPSLGAESRRAEVVVPADRPVTVRVGIRPSRRGRFTPTEIVVRVYGPWGLAGRQARRRLPGEVRVQPRFASRKEAELRINRARLLDVGLRLTRIRGGDTEFDQLREYTVDDESNRIDWAATARAGRPIVRTYRAERNQHVVNLLDSGRVMAGRVGGVPRLEHSMDAVMTLTAVAAGLGDRCGLAVFDRTLHTVVAAASGRSQLARVTDALFEVEPALVESDYRGAFAATLARFRRRSLLVIHTDLVEQVVAETLLPAMPLVARSHLVVVAAIQDPEVVAWATAPAGDGDEVRRRAAARSALADRDRAAARLRALGATVVDGPPGVVSARLTDSYLMAKATGSL